MKFKQFSRLALPIPLCGFFANAYAQSDKTNYPFSWKETTDPWYRSKAFAFKYPPDAAAATGSKGQAVGKAKAGHGPVCSNECNNTSAPDACTADLMSEKFKAVELQGFGFPSGYSGVEYVTFEVQTNGKVNGYQVVKQTVLCKPCVQTAVNLVASLGEWHPAVQDGILVKSTVVVPVSFKKMVVRQHK